MELHRSTLFLFSCTLAFAACTGDDGGGETTEAMGSSGATTSGVTSSTGPTSETATSVVTGSMDATGPAETSAETTAADTGSTTNAVDTDSLGCYGLGPRECMADALCMPIVGAPIVDSDGGRCLGEREFIECQPAAACGEAITFACPGLDGPQYQFGDTCTPEGWVDCGPPPDGDVPPC